MKELLQIVAGLTRRYTAGESTSITYEKANQLMGACIYCIREYENAAGESGNALTGHSSVQEQYDRGLALVRKKTEAAKRRYQQLSFTFDSYGNQNYEETVTRAMAGFFKYYDAEFEPQNTIITCDYPTIIPVLQEDSSGIDLMVRYLQYVELEQKLLSGLPREHVIELLYAYDRDYDRQYDNIAEPVMRHILGCMLIHKNMMKEGTDEDYRQFLTAADGMTEEELQSRLQILLGEFLERFYENDREMYRYFSYGISDFVAQIKCIEDTENLKNVIVL